MNAEIRITPAVAAVAVGTCEPVIRRRVVAGRFPDYDSPKTHNRLCWWRLTTLEKHDPHLAVRCAAILLALKSAA